MRNLLNPKWLLLLNTGPLLVLALLCYGEFTVIHTLLPPASVVLWQQFGLGLAVLAAATLSYVGWQWRRGQPLSVWYGGATLLAYTLYLALYTSRAADAVPREVPRWMVPTDILVYVWTFLMPTLFHALLVLVLRTTPPGRPYSALPSFGLAVAVPLGGWMAVGALGNVIRLFGGWSWWRVPGLEAVFVLGALALGPLLFLFFLVRGLYIMSTNRPDPELGLVWRLLITTVLPLVGLLANTGLFFGANNRDEMGIFGNFNSPWFYGLAVLNGVLLCLPAPAQPRWRLALLAGRSVLLGYTFYFFVVFLPLLPFSIFAVVLIGTGFLLLAPLMLLVVHVQTLADDVAALQAAFGRGRVRAVLVGGALTLPALLTLDYYHDRRTLHAALDYVYSPSYSQHYDLDAAALARTLAVVRQHKEVRNEFLSFGGTQQPYLSTYFNWLVLDNLTLSEDKLNELQNVFIGPDPATHLEQVNNFSPFPNPNPAPDQPVLRHLAARSTYDARQQAWVSWVDLEVANVDPARALGEYSTTFALPEGCWLSDYYLDIDGRREPGVLAERKAATWVYHQILNEHISRDPGLLTYTGPHQLELRVYPVVASTPRRTGFQVLHRQPLTLDIGGRPVQLGPPAPAGAAAPASAADAAPVVASGGGVAYLSAAAKQRLPLVQRRPYYHFLVDASTAQRGHADETVACIRSFQRAHPLPDSARFTLVNAYAAPVPAASWAQALASTDKVGGCYLTGAMRRTLAETQLHPAPTYPVLVIVTPSLTRCVLPTDFADLRAAYPESSRFYALLPDGTLEEHSLAGQSAQALPASPPPSPAAVRAWPDAARPQAYVPALDEPSVVLAHPAAAAAVPTAATSRWVTGLLLQGYAQWQALHPEAAEQDHVAFIQASFRTGILTPLTAYLALENEAQKAALRRKQGEVLAANANLDAEESTTKTASAVPLDDYAWLLVALALSLAWVKLGRR